MIYDMECGDCGHRGEIICSLADHESVVKPGMQCTCGGKMTQIITPPSEVFLREPFPKGDPRWEHATNEPVHIRDHVHLRDICEANGNISRYLEDRA